MNDGDSIHYPGVELSTTAGPAARHTASDAAPLRDADGERQIGAFMRELGWQDAMVEDGDGTYIVTVGGREFEAALDRFVSRHDATGLHPSAKQVSSWIEDHGFHSVGAHHVTLPNYDGEEGIQLDGDYLRSDDPLGDAVEHAKRFIRDVPSADDFGAEESDRLVTEWLDKNGYEAPVRTSAGRAHEYNCALNDPTPIIAGESRELAAINRAMHRCTCGAARASSEPGTDNG